MPSYTTCFRRFVGRTLSTDERLLMAKLERQRRLTHRVRAYIHDPQGRLTRLICEYVRWLQLRVDRRDCLMVTAHNVPRGHELLGMVPRLRTVCARRYMQLYGAVQCVGQVVLFGADTYCPSVAMHSNYLDRILSMTLPMLSGRNSVMIVCGNALHRRTRYFRAYAEWAARRGEARFFDALDWQGRRIADTRRLAERPKWRKKSEEAEASAVVARAVDGVARSARGEFVNVECGDVVERVAEVARKRSGIPEHVAELEGNVATPLGGEVAGVVADGFLHFVGHFSGLAREAERGINYGMRRGINGGAQSRLLVFIESHAANLRRNSVTSACRPAKNMIPLIRPAPEKDYPINRA